MVSVVSTSTFPQPSGSPWSTVIQVDTGRSTFEIIRVCNVSPTSFTVCADGLGGRGYDGTSATTHPNGTSVFGYLVARHINQLSAEIQSLESNAVSGPQTDIRSFGAVCDGTDQNTAVQAAITSGSTNIFIPAGCVWIAPGGIIPGGVSGNGITYRGANWVTSVIKSNANPAGTTLQAAPGVTIYEMNLEGNSCNTPTNCPTKYYTNLGNVNDNIVSTGFSWALIALGQGATDLSGTNIRNKGVGDGFFVDTYGAGPAVRLYADLGSGGAPLIIGTINGATGPGIQFITDTNNPGAPAFAIYDKTASLIETHTNDGVDTTSGYTAYTPASLTLVNGANQNVAIGFNGVFTTVGPTGAYSIGGITGGVAGRQLTIVENVGQILTINNEDAGSLAANRIFVPTNSNYVCPHAFCVLDFIYAGSQWHLKGSN